MIDVVLLHTTGCQSCEKARRIIESVIKEYPVNFEEKNLVEHPELATEYNVMSAPVIVIDGEIMFRGGASEQELRKELDTRTDDT